MADVAKLKEVLNAIQNFKENFNYSVTFDLKDELIEVIGNKWGPRTCNKLTKHGCNSSGCVIGFTASLFIPCDEPENIGIPKEYNYWEYACKTLDLVDEEALFLFQPFWDKAEYENDKEKYTEEYYAEHCSPAGEFQDKLYLTKYESPFEYFYWADCSEHDQDSVDECIRRLQFIIKHYETFDISWIYEPNETNS